MRRCARGAPAPGDATQSVKPITTGRPRRYWALAGAVDRSGIIYAHRVGDAPIRTLAVAALLPDASAVVHFADLPYQVRRAACGSRTLCLLAFLSVCLFVC